MLYVLLKNFLLFYFSFRLQYYSSLRLLEILWWLRDVIDKIGCQINPRTLGALHILFSLRNSKNAGNWKHPMHVFLFSLIFAPKLLFFVHFWAFLNVFVPCFLKVHFLKLNNMCKCLFIWMCSWMPLHKIPYVGTEPHIFYRKKHNWNPLPEAHALPQHSSLELHMMHIF